MEVIAQFIPLIVMLSIGWFFVVQARKRRNTDQSEETTKPKPPQENENFFSSIHYSFYIIIGAIAIYGGIVTMPEMAIELLQKSRSHEDVTTARDVDRFAPVVAILGGVVCALGIIKAILRK